MSWSSEDGEGETERTRSSEVGKWVHPGRGAQGTAVRGTLPKVDVLLPAGPAWRAQQPLVHLLLLRTW